MKLIDKEITFKELWTSKESDLGDILKIVVDLEKKVIAADSELHSDLEGYLLSKGSEQKNLWGANLVCANRTYSIEYTAFINIRPGQGNRSMEIEDPNIKLQTENLIQRLIR